MGRLGRADGVILLLKLRRFRGKFGGRCGVIMLIRELTCY